MGSATRSSQAPSDHERVASTSVRTEYNNRSDNLGDQIIFQALVRSLERHGRMLMTGEIPAFVEGVRPEGGYWHSWIVRLWTRARGGSIFQVLSPGAALWYAPSQSASPALPRAKRRLPPWLAGRIITLGRSVIPEADHSWCRDVDWIGVRDEDSLRAIRDAGFSRATYFPDLAFLIEPVGAGAPSKRSGICLSFRRSIPEDHHSDEYERGLRTSIAALVASLTPSERSQATGFHQVEGDADFVARLCEEGGLRQLVPMLTLSSHRGFFEAADMVVSNRLHCLLLGACHGALPVALTTPRHSKLVALFRTVGWQSLIVDAEDKASVEQFHAIRQDAPRLREMVRTTFAEQHRLGNDILRQRFRPGGDVEGIRPGERSKIAGLLQDTGWQNKR